MVESPLRSSEAKKRSWEAEDALSLVEEGFRLHEMRRHTSWQRRTSMDVSSTRHANWESQYRRSGQQVVAQVRSYLREVEVLAEVVSLSHLRARIHSLLSESLHALNGLQLPMHSPICTRHETHYHWPGFTQRWIENVPADTEGLQERHEQESSSTYSGQHLWRSWQMYVIRSGTIAFTTMALLLTCILLATPSLPSSERVIPDCHECTDALFVSPSMNMSVPVRSTAKLIEGPVAIEAKPAGLKSFSVGLHLQQQDESPEIWRSLESAKIDLEPGRAIKRLISFRKPELNSTSPARVVFQAENNESSQGVALETRMKSFKRDFALYKELVSALVLALTLFLIAIEVVDRVIAGMVGASLMLGLLLLLDIPPTLEELVAFIDVGVLILLFGMMLIAGQLSRTGCFDLLAAKVTRLGGGSQRLFMVLMSCFAGFLSMWLANAEVAILLAPVIFKAAERCEFDPYPHVIAVVLMINVFGALTLVGDATNVIIGIEFDKIQFDDFLVSLSPPILLTAASVLVFMLTIFRKVVRSSFDVQTITLPRITDKNLFITSSVVLVMTVLGFLLEPLSGVSAPLTAIYSAIVVLLLSCRRRVVSALEGIEWSTLIFFAALFVMVGALRKAGLIETIAKALQISIRAVPAEDKARVAITATLWMSGLASTCIANIPLAAVLAPVVNRLSMDPELKLNPSAMAWALVLGSNLGGNGTLVGAAANIVLADIAKYHGYHISFGRFAAVGMPSLIISLVISNAFLLARYG